MAQQADVIRGRITSQTGETVPNATVVATSIPNNVTRNARADRNGRFAITFTNGDGDYWITVSAIGFVQRRFELKRVADEDVLVADVALEPTVVQLDSVQVRAGRARPPRNDNAADISGTEKTVGNGAVNPTQAGNIAAMAASLPGVQLIPGADGNPDQFSVFGLGGDQNRSTINGMGFGGGDIPRDAATKSSLGTTPWDVSRGGFSGGLFSMKTQSGSNFSSRGLSSLMNAPQLEWTDRAGRAAGAEFTSLSLGASTAGPISLEKSFYSAGYQYDRRLSDLQNLTTADPFALQTAGISRDSVARLRSVLSSAGVPLSAGGLPGAKISDRGLFLGTFDLAPPTSTSGQALNVTAMASFNQLSSPLGQIAAMPTSDVQSRNWFGSLQARHTNYIGSGILTETSLGLTRTGASTAPYLALPSGNVRVSSSLDDGTVAINQLSFGGSPMQTTSNAATTIAAQNQLSWFSLDNKHRLKLTSELRYERYRQDLTTNQLGTFSYNSLSDLEAGTPASFMRLLSPRVVEGSQIVGALALGDSYRPSADLQVQYGLRLDANRFLASPAANGAIEQTFGVKNDAVPSKLYLSPRIGFSWTYGKAAQLAIANGFVRGPRAVVRGGVGVFQNAPNAQLLGQAIMNTGLAGGVQQVACVGSAVPAPDWNAYRGNPGAIPTACADGTSGTVFASMAPNVSLIDAAYSASRSVRSSVNWSGILPGNRFASTIDGTYSLNLNQPGMADLNFNPEVRFSLADEGGRPVYVQPGSIVPSTGAIAGRDARRSQDFASVMDQRSDLRSVSRQFTIGIQPVSFSTRFSWNLAYVYSNTRDLASGLMSTSGDPRVKAWGRSSFDSRNQIVYSVAYNFFNWFPVSLSGSVRSGRPFTPLVAADVNGDGFRNDRAFVFDPASVADQSLVSGLTSLLQSGPAAARACLASQLGQIAARNSCQAPWSTTSNLTIALNPVKFRLPQRLNVSFYVNNAFGAADLLFHGESKRRGWGQSISPEQALLFVRGFDPATQKFTYEVNPRFGSTSVNQTVNRNPVVVTMQVRMDIGFARERQLLTQSLDRGRVRPGNKPSDQEITGMSGALIPANPMTLILQQSDSLKLTRQQADSLSTLNRVYSRAFTSIWTPVAKYLAALPPEYDRAGAYSRYRKAREASVDALMKLAPSIRGLLTPVQLRALPAQVMSSLDTRYLASVRSSTAGGADMGVLGMLAQMGWMGGTVDASGGSQTIMVHK
jgi:hypothetical protein